MERMRERAVESKRVRKRVAHLILRPNIRVFVRFAYQTFSACTDLCVSLFARSTLICSLFLSLNLDATMAERAEGAFELCVSFIEISLMICVTRSMPKCG